MSSIFRHITKYMECSCSVRRRKREFAFIGGPSPRREGGAERGKTASGGHWGDDLAKFGFSVDTASGFA